MSIAEHGFRATLIASVVPTAEGADPAVANDSKALIHKYESAQGLEAQCARDADKLECMFQAIEFRDAAAGLDRDQPREAPHEGGQADHGHCAEPGVVTAVGQCHDQAVNRAVGAVLRPSRCAMDASGRSKVRLQIGPRPAVTD